MARSSSSSFTKKLASKKSFIIQVYSVLVVQLVVSYSIVAFLRSKPELEKKVAKLWLVWALSVIGLILVTAFIQNPVFRAIVFALITILTGLLLTATNANSSSELIRNCLIGAISIFLFVSLVAYAITAMGYDLSFMGFFLFIGLIGLIIASVVIALTGKSTKQTHKWIGGIILVLFSLYVAYDTNMMILYGTDVLDSALGFYLDIINLSNGVNAFLGE